MKEKMHSLNTRLGSYAFWILLWNKQGLSPYQIVQKMKEMKCDMQENKIYRVRDSLKKDRLITSEDATTKGGREATLHKVNFLGLAEYVSTCLPNELNKAEKEQLARFLEKTDFSVIWTASDFLDENPELREIKQPSNFYFNFLMHLGTLSIVILRKKKAHVRIQSTEYGKVAGFMENLAQLPEPLLKKLTNLTSDNWRQIIDIGFKQSNIAVRKIMRKTASGK